MSIYQRKLGNWGENLAIIYLQKSGYDIIARHWQRREGEIDIVALDKSSNWLVFVEVKTRRSSLYGNPDESISEHKKKTLNNIIDLYIQECNYQGHYRFDAIMVEIKGEIVIHHLSNVSLE